MEPSYRLLSLVSCAAFGALSAPTAFGQHPIGTDRPGFLFSASLVEPGVLQVEAGTPLLFHDEEGGVETDLVTLPTQLRYGLADSLELRLGSSVYNWLDATGAPELDGIGDVEVGVKTPLPLPPDADAAGIILAARIPAGEDAFSVDGVAPSVNAMASWTVAENVGVTGLAGISYVPVDGAGDPIVASLAGLASRSFGDGWTGAVETAWFPEIEDAVDTAFLGVFLTKLLSDDVLLDVSVDRGLTDDSADWLVGVGLSFHVLHAR